MTAPALMLAPDSSRGWFGGRCLLATGPADFRDGVSLGEAAEALRAAFEGSEVGVTVAVLRYEGGASVMRFESVGELPPLPAPSLPASAPLLLDAAPDLDGRAFRAAVAEVRERVAAGDVYVLNLTARFSGTLALDPAGSFAALRARSGAAMSAYLEMPDGSALASVSPERFLRVRAENGRRTVEVCPIKGTRPRGATPAEDALLASDLAADPKECAEHLMVVDLERNDLGRACVPGSIAVRPLYEVVPTPYCHQMVSTVSGELLAEATFADLLASAFPCGSVTGAPKIAAVRIAAELERSPRGAYCGALVVAMPGEMDSSVLIRTLECDAARTARWGAGAGITYDSDAAAEWLETLLKASPVLGDRTPDRALRETARVTGGRVPLLTRHLTRLAEGGCGPTMLGEARRRIEAALTSGPSEGRLSLTACADGSVVAATDAHASTLAVEGGPRLVPVEVPGPPSLPSNAAKPASRRWWDRAHAAARLRGGDQALLVGADGCVIDGSTATVWIRRGDRLLTPPAPPAIAGVMRGLVFDLAPELGYSAEQAPLTQADVDSAEEVFLTNAHGGIVPARGRDGEARRALAEVLAEVWR